MFYYSVFSCIDFSNDISVMSSVMIILIKVDLALNLILIKID